MVTGSVEKARTVLLAGGDLMAKARLAAAAESAGVRLDTVRVGNLRQALEEAHPDVLVLDLDGGRTEVLDELKAAGDDGHAPERVVGYYSHVDGSLRDAAKAAGCRAVPRGRFWNNLAGILGGEEP